MRNKERVRSPKELAELLKSLNPVADDTPYVFVTLQDKEARGVDQGVFARIREEEGETLIMRSSDAQRYALAYEGLYARITLTVQSSLEAVGLSAAISTAFAKRGIAVNIVAGYYHDHLFVPFDRLGDAMASLREIQEGGSE